MSYHGISPTMLAAIDAFMGVVRSEIAVPPGTSPEGVKRGHLAAGLQMLAMNAGLSNEDALASYGSALGSWVGVMDLPEDHDVELILWGAVLAQAASSLAEARAQLAPLRGKAN